MFSGIPFIKEAMVMTNEIPKIHILTHHSGIGLDKFYGRFIAPDKHIAMMRFPAAAKNSSERRSQQINYDCFISTMAGLMKKYADK